MKLPIKKKYADQIKNGSKKFEYRDAHITFMVEETGEEIRVDVINAKVIENNGFYADVCKDKKLIQFELVDSLKLRKSKGYYEN